MDRIPLYTSTPLYFYVILYLLPQAHLSDSFSYYAQGVRVAGSILSPVTPSKTLNTHIAPEGQGQHLPRWLIAAVEWEISLNQRMMETCKKANGKPNEDICWSSVTNPGLLRNSAVTDILILIFISG